MLNVQRNRVRQFIELSGFYRFKTDPGKIGEQEGWPCGLPDYREIAVPSSWNEQYQDLSEYLGTAWYERTEYVPADWKGQKTILRISAAYYYSKVWINGIYAGENTGGSLPFEFDASDKIEYGGKNKIVVSVNAEQDPDRLPPGNFPPSEWESPWQGQYPSNNYDFYPYAGIHRPVYLYSLPETHIENVAVTTDVRDGAGVVEFQASVSSGDYDKVKVFIDGVLRKETTSDSSVIIENPALWDVGQPNLYDLTLVLEINGQTLDEYTIPVGIRTVKTEGNKLLLNGRPVFLTGFGKHEDFMILGKGLNHALIVKDYNLMDWIGANSFRTSHYPYSEEMLEYADRHGVLVISETPLVGLMKRNFQQKGLNDAKEQLSRLIERDRNHPSVIMWSVANEPTSNQPESENFFIGLYNHAKSLDDTRPVALVSCIGSESDVALKHFDVICVNRYYGWYSEPGQLDLACELLDKDLENCFQTYKKPIMVTEFGADAIPGMHYDPPRQFTEEYQAQMITRQYEIIRSKEFTVGAHVWAFADFKTSQIYMRVVLNYKGVFTRERQPKLAAHALRKIWRG